VIAGVAFQFTARADIAPKTEKWMEDQAPVAIGSYRFIPGGENPKQSYRMGESTYETLKPYGIVSRIFEFDGKRYDTVLIASQNNESFHNPEVCFTGQGAVLLGQDDRKVVTQSHGDIPVRFVHMKSSDDINRLAVFFYKGPKGFHSTTQSLKVDMAMHVLTKGKKSDGVFYRIIAMNPDTSEADLLKFVGNFVDAANASSKGYF
jgi:hypothetical protein